MNTPNQNETSDCMLDTVVLKIRHPDFRATNPNLFTPAFDVQKIIQTNNYAYGRHTYAKYKLNPSSQDKQDDNHAPRLTVYQRLDEGNLTFDLLIEFSIPKLIFKQSLQELSESDFELVVGTLRLQLQRMGVEVTEDAIRRSCVSKAHFGKNIPLPSPITAQDAIAELYKADMGKGKHINMRHYENGGQALYFYASSFCLVFYDKLRDIATPKNKAVDKSKSRQERALIESSSNTQELLRFEVRLAKQQSLWAFLSEALGTRTKNITFEEIFKKDLWKKVLQQSWKLVINGPSSQLALKMDAPLEEIFDAIILGYILTGKKKAHSLNKALQDFAMYVLVNKCGARKIRDKIEKNWTPKSWSRQTAKMRNTVENLKELPVAHIVSDIQLALDNFTRYDWQP